MLIGCGITLEQHDASSAASDCFGSFGFEVTQPEVGVGSAVGVELLLSQAHQLQV
jgi:hypothetical protein